ncbi:MAG: Tex family protein [Methylococcaceae bacterium]|nr:Tex family protein [Methylococcaceae bacterium]
MNIPECIAEELSINPKQVIAAIDLLDQGSTVPFIARYRKEITQGLDDTQLRQLAERLLYLRHLYDRQQRIIVSIDNQGKLTPQLKQCIKDCRTKTDLEDLYLPYKPKRQTKAQKAREAGLGALAEALLKNRSTPPLTIANQFLNPSKNIPDNVTALEGAKHIISEQLFETPTLIQNLRNYIWKHGCLKSSVLRRQEQAGQKFSDYFNYQEAIRKIPSHRALAIFRGRNEGFLKVTINPTALESTEFTYGKQLIRQQLNCNPPKNLTDQWLQDVGEYALTKKLLPRIETDLCLKVRDLAEAEAITVFANNLRDLLLAAPAGPKITIGLDPGIRTGVKLALIDGTGKIITTETIYPHPPKKQWSQSINQMTALIKKHTVELISIGNGTGSRETEKMITDLLTENPDLTLRSIIVSEAGASIYSASELAAHEFPNLDVSLRGAVSIARRLQDPLAELVKIEAKSIGVGQYQHDVNQSNLSRSLNAVVEDCVNAVGVDVNTASVALLKQVSGLTESVSQNIVNYRNEQGPFQSRSQLKKVPRLGDKAYEQAAGFLRIANGKNPLDASAVHPECYPIVKNIAQKTNVSLAQLINNEKILSTVDPETLMTQNFGLPTIIDIISELKKPGRDPRPEFKNAQFKTGIEKLADLIPGMVLEGVVTNVANFGAFVDIGVHQDGLVHISELAHTFVKDPRQIVKTGNIVTVRVLNIEPTRKRIQLTMKIQGQSQTMH